MPTGAVPTEGLAAGAVPTEGLPAGAVPTEGLPAQAVPTEGRGTGGGATFADLDRRPVAEHVAVFEAEHARLQRELGTIDQL
ncbi:hypothetical protein [Geodermatophilus sp. URMC 60]